MEYHVVQIKDFDSIPRLVCWSVCLYIIGLYELRGIFYCNYLTKIVNHAVHIEALMHIFFCPHALGL